MKTYGYTRNELASFQYRVKHVRKQDRRHKKNHPEQYQHFQVLDAKWLEARKIYFSHREIARGVFRNEPEYLDELNLSGWQEVLVNDWVAKRRTFYAHLLENEEALDRMAKRGVLKSELERGEALVIAVEKTDLHREVRRAEATDPMADEEQALAELDDVMREFLYFARLALRNKPRLLRMIGRVIESGQI